MKTSDGATTSARTPVARAWRGAIVAHLVSLTLTGCWGTTRLDMMPTPLIHQQIGSPIYAGFSEEACSPVTELFYATSRLGWGGRASRRYGNGSLDRLYVGHVKIRRGDAEMDWEELVFESTHGERTRAIPLRIEGTSELAALGRGDSSDFIESVDRALENSPGDCLTIFVPGAQSSFYKSCAHATQLKHFMANSGVCITYSWPSTGKFVTYPLDVRYARTSQHHLADLIDYVCSSTEARRINLFAYSAGAQLLAPALASLADRHPGLSAAALRQRYRIGDVYFASPDISAQEFFTEHLPAFSDYVGRTTFTYNREDGLLKLSHFILRDPRAGCPTGGRSGGIENRWLTQAQRHPAIDAIDLTSSPGGRPAESGAHGAWYLNSWVSSDLILLLEHGLAARARGLEEKADGTGWFFPDDYPERLREIGSSLWASDRQG